MSGICAVWRGDPAGAIGPALGRAIAGLALHPSERAAQERDGEAGVAVSARSSAQQIYADARMLVACDLDLLNAQELRESVWETAAAGSTEAAVLGALYERFGAGFVEKLRGAFAVVLWDRRARRLVAAVDGFGIKRLVYAASGKSVAVASRIPALAAGEDIDLAVNPRAIPNLLNFSMNLGPETIFRQVRRVPPGHVLTAGDGGVEVKPYWDMRYEPDGAAGEEHLSRELESLFERTVREYCESVPAGQVGAFLSGGTDSSTVVGMMSRAGRGRVKAFSIGFEEQPFNEMGYARIAAERFRAEHHTYLVSAADCFRALPEMIRYFDEPFGNSSSIATYFCCRLAETAGVKRMLAGDGGDELFGGNERYATDKIYGLYHSVPQALRKGLIEPVLKWMPAQNGIVGRGRRYVERANMPGMDRILCHQFLCTHDSREIFESDFLNALDGYSILEAPRRYFDGAPARDPLDRVLYADVKITLGDSDLPKVTCMAEMAGIEARFPFLDRAVAEFSARLPANLKVRGFQKRYLFKKAFGKLLPAEIIQKKKHGFGIPVASWLKTDPRLRELCRDALGSRECVERGYFRREFVDRLFREHESDATSYYGDTLWTLLTLELWHREWKRAASGVRA